MTNQKNEEYYADGVIYEVIKDGESIYKTSEVVGVLSLMIGLIILSADILSTTNHLFLYTVLQNLIGFGLILFGYKLVKSSESSESED